MNPALRPLLAIALGTLAAAVRAQSLEAFQGLYAQTAGGSFVATDAQSGARDASDPFTASRDFAGRDRQGNPQTMNVEGSAYSSSEFGRLHLFGEGTVTNPYYSPDNPPVIDGNGDFDPSGSPETLAIHGNAGWTDRYTYTGFQGTGYKVNYYFRLEGTTLGDTEAGLNFSTSAISPTGSSYYGPRTTRGNELWITPLYDVVWGVPTDVSVDMYAGLTTHLSQRAEGATLVGLADYSNTLVLEGVVVRDPSGKVVTGYSVATASGLGYVHPVPEPATLASLAMGGLGFARRRRRTQG